MKTFDLHRDVVVPAPLDEVFAFFAEPRNLAELTPPWLAFTMLGDPLMARGTRIDYTLRVWGFPLRWQSEITEYAPPWRFVDEQRRGPYRLWHHEHRFAAAAGGTRVTDDVTYALHGGPLLRPLVHSFVRRDLERIFAYRHEALVRRFPPVAA